MRSVLLWQARQASGVSLTVFWTHMESKTRKQKGSFESGFSDHVGEWRGTLVDIPVIERDFITWSESINSAFILGSSARSTNEFIHGFGHDKAFDRAGNYFL